MTTQPNPGDHKGEGSYEGTRDYNRRTEKFLDEHGNEVDRLAQDAAEALDGSEAEELDRAEAAGKAPARK